MKIARIFPRKTKASPDDPLAFFDVPPLLFPPEIDEVHISCAFTYDIPRAEWLADQWSALGKPVKIGGPAYNERGGDFVPGRYLKKGYVITSRGCPNKCWFCSVWKREPEVKELPITDGWIIQDDNLLACSESHIRAVFDMLKRQPKPIEFTGGIEARLLKPWHVELFKTIRLGQMFMAYDTPDDYEPLRRAARLLIDINGFKEFRKLRAYVLIGHPKDTISAAEKRLNDVMSLGILPMAMLWRNENREVNKEWQKFQRLWARPALIKARAK